MNHPRHAGHADESVVIAGEQQRAAERNEQARLDAIRRPIEEAIRKVERDYGIGSRDTNKETNKWDSQ